MIVHILLDMVVQFFVWLCEYGDLVFLVVGMKVDLMIQFFLFGWRDWEYGGFIGVVTSHLRW